MVTFMRQILSSGEWRERFGARVPIFPRNSPYSMESLLELLGVSQPSIRIMTTFIESMVFPGGDFEINPNGEI